MDDRKQFFNRFSPKSKKKKDSSSLKFDPMEPDEIKVKMLVSVLEAIFKNNNFEKSEKKEETLSNSTLAINYQFQVKMLVDLMTEILEKIHFKNKDGVIKLARVLDDELIIMPELISTMPMYFTAKRQFLAFLAAVYELFFIFYTQSNLFIYKPGNESKAEPDSEPPQDEEERKAENKSWIVFIEFLYRKFQNDIQDFQAENKAEDYQLKRQLTRDEIPYKISGILTKWNDYYNTIQFVADARKQLKHDFIFEMLNKFRTYRYRVSDVPIIEILIKENNAWLQRLAIEEINKSTKTNKYKHIEVIKIISQVIEDVLKIEAQLQKPLPHTPTTRRATLNSAPKSQTPEPVRKTLREFHSRRKRHTSFGEVNLKGPTLFSEPKEIKVEENGKDEKKEDTENEAHSNSR